MMRAEDAGTRAHLIEMRSATPRVDGGGQRPALASSAAERPAEQRAAGAALRVLVIIGHARADSLCAALAEAFVDGARAAGCAVTVLNLAEMTFHPDVTAVSPTCQALEPDLAQARQLID